MMPENLQAARYKLCVLRPYLSHVLWNFYPIETEFIPTMGVDKYLRIYWNKKFVEATPVDQLAWVLYHEVMHVRRAHPARCEGRLKTPLEMEAWKLATDYEINDDLDEEPNHNLPPDHIHPSDMGFPTKLTAEEYVDLVKKKAKVQGGQPGGKQQGKGGKKQQKPSVQCHERH